MASVVPLPELILQPGGPVPSLVNSQTLVNSQNGGLATKLILSVLVVRNLFELFFMFLHGAKRPPENSLQAHGYLRVKLSVPQKVRAALSKEVRPPRV
eukprot:2350557-Amphidinium_carterae.1